MTKEKEKKVDLKNNELIAYAISDLIARVSSLEKLLQKKGVFSEKEMESELSSYVKRLSQNLLNQENEKNK